MLSFRKLNILLTSIIMVGLLLAACQPAPPPAPPPTQDETQVANSVNATLTASAPQAPAATSTIAAPSVAPTAAEPSPMPTPAPIEGDPAVELGAPDGVDTFDSAVNFAPLESSCFASDVTGGQFVMASKGIAGIYCWQTSWPTIENFYIETTTIMPETCTSGDNFGLLFRSPSSVEGYLFGLSCNGEYSLKRVTGGTVSQIIPPTASDKILVGAGQVNRMGIEAYSGTYYLYANGQYLTTANDATYLMAGEIGYYVNAATNTPFVTRYEDLKIWKLEDTYYPPSAPPPAYPPAQPAPPASGAPTVTATTYVNVRTGPSTNYPILGVAAPGAIGEVSGISQDGGWYMIKVPTSLNPSGSAWVSVDYVILSNPSNVAIPVIPPTTPPPTVAPPPPSTGVPSATALEAVNVRSGPSTDYPVYGVAPIGASAPLVGKSQDGGWVVVNISTAYSPDGTGWVSAAYVSISGTTLADLPVITPPPLPPDIAPPPPPSGALVVQTTEPVNVRAGPGNEYPSYGKVPVGTPLQAVGISQDGTWTQVVIPTTVAPSGFGWVSTAYLQPFDSSSLPQV